jgi:VanZ family protein
MALQARTCRCLRPSAFSGATRPNPGGRAPGWATLRRRREPIRTAPGRPALAEAASRLECRLPRGGAYDYPIAIAVRTRARLWLPVVIWAAVIFAFSSIPSLSTGLGTWDLVLRKLAHGAEYAILGGLLYRWLSSVPLAILAGSAYAATDELHQSFVPGRAGLVTDWLIDTAAVVIGVGLLVAWRHRR